MKDKSLKNSWRKLFMFDFIIAISILLLPFLIYLHLLFDQDVDYLNIYGFHYYHDFISNQTFVWYIISSLINFIYVVFVFATSYGKWRYLLFPIIIYYFFSPIVEFTESGSYLDFFVNLYGVLSLLVFVLMSTLICKLTLSFKDNALMAIPKSMVLKEIFSSWGSRYNKQLKSLISNKSNLSLREYLSRIYYLKEIVNKKYNPIYSNKPLESSRGKNRFISIGLFFTIFILFSLLFLEYFIPSNRTSIQIGNIDFQSFGFLDVKTFVWYTSQKFVILVLVILWFVNSFYWWRWAILSPIIFYSYQFWESFQSTYEIESAGNLSVFPLVFLTIGGVFLLSRVIRRISINLDYKAFLEAELDKSLGELSREASRNLSKIPHPESR